MDTFPYNAGTTASDALKMGVPVLTLSGETFSSRIGRSLLNTLNLLELATNSFDEYSHLAIKIATDPEYHGNLKIRLQKSLNESLLFNPSSFVLDLELAFSKVVSMSRKGLVTEDINLSI